MANRRKRRKHRFLAIAGVLGVALQIRVVDASESLAASFDGTNFLGQYHADGNIFEIRAAGSPVTITRFDLNVHAGSTGILVRTKAGVEGTVQEPGNSRDDDQRH